MHNTFQSLSKLNPLFTAAIVLAAACPAFSTSPPYSVAHHGSQWHLVAPDGTSFFSLGVCVVTQGTPRDQYDAENPSYAAWQHYPDDRAWANATLRRLKSWGFSTIGAWSDLDALSRSTEMDLGLTPVLHAGSTAGAPWWDMWDPKIVARMDATAREQILAVRDNPRLIGYYTDNELGWWNATLWKMTLEHAPSSGQRRRLIELLRTTYANDWSKLLEDFESDEADGWESLENRGVLYLRPGGNGAAVMRQFLKMVAERYYDLTREIIRKYDRRALILGDRFQSFYYPEVAQACAQHVDVVSTNLNAGWNDGTLPRFYLETLHALTKKPILVSEIYLAASDNRSGNRNSHGVFPVVATQAERAQGLRTTLHELLSRPFVIGADWFQYTDEPRHGRGDGEDFNFGLVDILDQPYADVTSVPASIGVNRVRAQPSPPCRDATQGVPPAPHDPFAQLETMRALEHWDRQRGFVPTTSQFPLADLYACWSPRSLYLGLWAFDFIEENYYWHRIVPKQDRPQWTVQIDNGPAIRARLGGARQPIPSDPGVRIECLSARQSTVRDVAVIELPAAKFGREELKAGDTIRLQATLRAHAGTYAVEWDTKLTLAEE